MPYLQATQEPDVLAAFEPTPPPEPTDGTQLHLFPHLVIVLDELDDPDESKGPPSEMTGMYYLG